MSGQKGTDQAFAVANYGTDKLLVAGKAPENTKTGQGADAVLMRYNLNGTLDKTFDGDGIVQANFRGSDKFTSVIEADGGKIYASGLGANGGIVARYTSAGKLDRTFSGDGLLDVQIPSRYRDGTTGAYLVGLGTYQGKLLVAARLFSQTGTFFWDDIAVARYNADGTVDTTFGDYVDRNHPELGRTGSVVTELGDPVSNPLNSGNFLGLSDNPTAMAVNQATGAIYVVGSAYEAEVEAGQSFLAAYDEFGVLTSATLVDFSPATNGVPNRVTNEAHAVSIQGDKILVAGSLASDTADKGYFALARCHELGGLDTDFGTNGNGIVVTKILDFTNASAQSVVQSGSRILVSGWAGNDASEWAIPRVIAVAAYDQSGKLDPTFTGQAPAAASALVASASAVEESAAVDFDPTSGVAPLQSAGGYGSGPDPAAEGSTDLFVVKLTQPSSLSGSLAVSASERLRRTALLAGASSELDLRTESVDRFFSTFGRDRRRKGPDAYRWFLESQ